jgi:hypothetical protein
MTGYLIKSGMTWLRCLVAAVLRVTTLELVCLDGPAQVGGGLYS